MIQKIEIQKYLTEKTVDLIIKSWKSNLTKIIHLSGNLQKNNIKSFYENLGNKIGEFKMYAEDVKLGDRNNQKSGKIWMDVRYDSNITEAYRHSSKPQPLHTDGSYIPEFPNASIMCCISNTAEHGETIFLHIEKLVKILKAEKPKLLEFLLNNEIIHERSGYINKKKILYKEDENYKVNFNFYCISKKNSTERLKAVEEFFNFLNNSELIKNEILQVKLASGEAVFWKDNELLHGRNGFLPKKNSERFLWKAAIQIGK